MFKYNQYCPVAKAAEILGDRWTILIIREAIFGCCHFNEFHRNLPGISRSVLSDRLQRLESVDVLERQAIDSRRSEYTLTPVGHELKAVVFAMGGWGARWIVTDPTPKEADPDTIMLFIARHLRESELPEKRVVVEFNLRANRRRRTYWLVLMKGASSLCRQYPGYETNVSIASKVTDLQKVYLGRSTWADAVRNGSITIDGPKALVRRFPKWMLWSRFAPVVAERAGESKRNVSG